MLSKRPKNVPEFVMNEVDRWPSHAAGRSYASSSILVSNGRLIVLSEEETKIPNLIPKPKFLSYLEDRISKNLATVKAGDIDGRLQVFREAFSTILSTFKTYEPILTQIYREYEVAFNHYKLEIQKLRPAKEYLWTIYQECDERILAMQKRERPELEELQRKISQLKCVISEQKEEQTMMELEIEKLKESLEEEHARYRHESDARNLLITEINTMRNQYNEIEGVARQTQAIAKEAGDPTLLKIALENARKAQSKAEFELIRLKSEYVDIVPKKEYDALMQKYQDQWTLMEEYKTKFAEATSNLKTFEEQLAAVTAERDEYMSSIHQLNTASTPRPDWNEVGRRLPCGENKWNEDTQGMTSREKLNHLLHEMDAIGKETNPQPTSFSTKGFSNPVPRFLRSEEPVYRRTVQLRDCLILTQEIWTYRKIDREKSKTRITPTTAASKSPTVSVTFDEALEKYFDQTYSLPKIRLEWAYGFYEGLNRHKDFVALGELKKIIDNEMDESCHWHRLHWLEKVKEHLITMLEKEDLEVDNLTATFINRDTLESALSSITGQRFANRIAALVERALDVCAHAHVEQRTEVDPNDEVVERPVEQVEYAEKTHITPPNAVGRVEELFRFVPGEDYNPFIRGLIELYEAIKSSYIEEILTELHKSVDHENQGKLVNATQLAHAIESVSPTTAVTTEPRSRTSRVSFASNPISIDVSTSIAWIMRAESDAENTMNSVPMETLVSRIAGANLYPVSLNF